MHDTFDLSNRDWSSAHGPYGDPAPLRLACDGTLLAPSRPAWHADALCREHPEVNFFPKTGEDLRPARAVCGSCAVRAECLAYALTDSRLEGVWAGTSGRERRRLRLGRVA